MSWRPQRRRGRVPNVPGGRGVCFCVLVLFCFQFSRFYLTVEGGQFLCLDADVPDFSAPHHHHEGELSAAHHSDGGYSIEHCKDTLDGIPLTPVQPFGTAAAMTLEPSQLVAAAFPVADPVAPDGVLPSPFQPPRV